MLSVNVMRENGYEGWGSGDFEVLKARINRALQKAEELLRSGLVRSAQIIILSAISDLQLAGLEHLAGHDDSVSLSEMESDTAYGPVIGLIKEWIKKHDLFNQMSTLARDQNEDEQIHMLLLCWEFAEVVVIESMNSVEID